MGSIGGMVDQTFGTNIMGSTDKAKGAAKKQAGYEQEALDYLREREELPQELREGALQGLAGAYGMEGAEGQQEIIDRAISSPLYQGLMGGQEAGEEAILRSASATGGLRSGNVQENLADYSTQLQNQALLQSYNQQVSGMQGLAELPSLALPIAGAQAGIGQTLAMGDVASAQGQQAGQQQGMGNLMGMGNLITNMYGQGMFSDRRLKTNVKRVGTVKGHPWYSWDWNGIAHRMGLTGSTSGVMADEALSINPAAVNLKDGFLFVNYTALGVM